MFYKIVKDNKVIDVIDKPIYLKYQEKNKIMLICDEYEAQAIQSSDGKYIWHVEQMYSLPVGGYDTVEMIPIDEYEYTKLKVLNGKSPEEIIDMYTLLLMERGIL